MLKLENIHWDLPDGEELIKGVDLEIEPGKLTVTFGRLPILRPGR